jgi:hypothetical protein
VGLLAAGATFRANPDFKLVLMDRVSGPLREALVAGARQGDVYGALVPRGKGELNPIAVSPDTALLFLTLDEADRLPSYVLERLGPEAEKTIGRLVLDRVLQVKRNSDFVCGPNALDLIGLAPAPDAASDLAVEALRYGQSLVGLEPGQLALRLYCFGRRPISRQLSHHLPDPAAITKRLSGQGWNPVPLGTEAGRHWHEWVPRSAAEATHRPGFKLYVSPVPTELRGVIEHFCDLVQTARGIIGFKLGAGIGGLARPDKLVAYFSQLEDLHSLADELRTRLHACTAHGVPFTAAITADGLLSWGADPARPTGGGAAQSWRMWVVGRLAEHIVAARDAGPSQVEPWQFALERLRLAGVDTATWVPVSGMWSAAVTG